MATAFHRIFSGVMTMNAHDQQSTMENPTGAAGATGTRQVLQTLSLTQLRQAYWDELGRDRRNDAKTRQLAPFVPVADNQLGQRKPLKQKARPSRPSCPSCKTTACVDLEAKGQFSEKEIEVFPYGTSVSGRPLTWTGKVVSLKAWRSLSDWAKHGSTGKVWNGATRRWDIEE